MPKKIRVITRELKLPTNRYETPAAIGASGDRGSQHLSVAYRKDGVRVTGHYAKDASCYGCGRNFQAAGNAAMPKLILDYK